MDPRLATTGVTRALLALLLPCCIAVGCGDGAEPPATTATTTATTATTPATTGSTAPDTTPDEGTEDEGGAILVEQPAAGDVARSPLRVSGSANVFEAVLFVELRDGGRIVTTRRVMASAGTGTRGTFATVLRFDAGGLDEPVLIAYTNSPRDGSRENVVDVPLEPMR